LRKIIYKRTKKRFFYSLLKVPKDNLSIQRLMIFLIIKRTYHVDRIRPDLDHFVKARSGLYPVDSGSGSGSGTGLIGMFD
jgi:hypothetical protein